LTCWHGGAVVVADWDTAEKIRWQKPVLNYYINIVVFSFNGLFWITD
jgi:hypothetical protein